ncbi:restriction endonuclease subunit S [Luminiphilus sp.]|nr:restriction endonuclease subunit S [Luminiphilus sp.]
MYGAGGQKRVPEIFVKNFPLVYPSIEEQERIVSFLDCETAKIDELVDDYEKLIELLQEKRKTMISHAVTKGLDTDAPMRPSGIGWLGDVPEHWDVIRIKFVAEMQSGHTPDKKVSAYWEDGDIPWVSLNDTKYLKDNEYISDTAYRINELGLANSSARLLPPRVVVFSRDATIGRCAITTEEMAVSQHFIAWICSESLSPEYLLFCLRSMTQELDRLSAGATLKTIGMSDVKRLAIPIPTIEEQNSIVDTVRLETKMIDDLISEAERAVEILEERRLALINMAVKGAIDVRKEARD